MKSDTGLKRIEKEKKKIEQQRTEKQWTRTFGGALVNGLLTGIVIIVEPNEQNRCLNENAEEENEKRTDRDEDRLP